MLPIDVKSLIDDALIENNRIEFKKDWNLEKTLHTICAFANDMDNIGGGYIVVGVEEMDGRPSGRIGIDANGIPAMERELFKLCNLMKHTALYTPEAIFAFFGKNLAYLLAVAFFYIPVKVVELHSDLSCQYLAYRCFASTHIPYEHHILHVRLQFSVGSYIYLWKESLPVFFTSCVLCAVRFRPPCRLPRGTVPV